ncbi:hypothetical protein BCR41DRAFT_367909 [Lobosporangium transversale]|uniref:Uncharacterized protein n=1 Tax=Lobosporangium transversale TaxID=64571 RepID=A0A1Y2GX95_9FUNG|nr:hypothetical protein BCR41DRAFT_367909 [Lobosporangium transversale]ORZ26909.1 hypothetical protein BCR41DRAFT_367909 [Lobosporangium transversale]|eukprot:XP_021884656.1 hypothetical protein BCR41DRAFT_367909 [Lobosporangium transversale]
MVSKRKAEDQLYAGFGKKAFTYYNNVAEEVGTTVFNATSTPPTPFRVNGVNVTASSLHSIPVTTSTANSVQSVSTDNIKEYIIPTNGAHLSIYTGLPTLKEYCLSLAIPTTSLSASSASSLNPSMLVPNVAAITSTLVTQPPVSEPQFSFVVAPTSSITGMPMSFFLTEHLCSHFGRVHTIPSLWPSSASQLKPACDCTSWVHLTCDQSLQKQIHGCLLTMKAIMF